MKLVISVRGRNEMGHGGARGLSSEEHAVGAPLSARRAYPSHVSLERAYVSCSADTTSPPACLCYDVSR